MVCMVNAAAVGFFFFFLCCCSSTVCATVFMIKFFGLLVRFSWMVSINLVSSTIHLLFLIQTKKNVYCFLSNANFVFKTSKHPPKSLFYSRNTSNYLLHVSSPSYMKHQILISLFMLNMSCNSLISEYDPKV